MRTMVGVAGAFPGDSCGRVGSQEVVWQVGTVVAMVVVAEGAPWVLGA